MACFIKCVTNFIFIVSEFEDCLVLHASDLMNGTGMLDSDVFAIEVNNNDFNQFELIKSETPGEWIIYVCANT